MHALTGRRSIAYPGGKKPLFCRYIWKVTAPWGCDTADTSSREWKTGKKLRAWVTWNPNWSVPKANPRSPPICRTPPPPIRLWIRACPSQITGRSLISEMDGSPYPGWWRTRQKKLSSGNDGPGGVGLGGGDQVQRFTPGDHPKGFVVFIRDPNLSVQLVILNNPAFNLV